MVETPAVELQDYDLYLTLANKPGKSLAELRKRSAFLLPSVLQYVGLLRLHGWVANDAVREFATKAFSRKDCNNGLQFLKQCSIMFADRVCRFGIASNEAF